MREYLEITKITAPAESEAGKSVGVVIEITSKVPIMYACPYVRAGDTPEWQGSWRTLYPGSKNYWVFSFVMPNKSVSFNVEAWYQGTDGKLYKNDEKLVNIELTSAEPPSTELAAEIINIRVKDESHAPAKAPQATIQGKKLSVSFEAHNTGAKNVHFYSEVTLEKPSGGETKSDRSESGGPLGYKTCTIDAFDFSDDWVADEIGTYYVTIVLKASTIFGYNYQKVAETRFKAFTVSGAPADGEPPGEGLDAEITNIRVWDESHAPAKAPQETVQGKKLSVSFDAHNTGSGRLHFYSEVTLEKPSGAETKTDKSESGVPLGYATCTSDAFSFSKDWVADELGSYYVSIVLKASTIFGYNYQEVASTRFKAFTVAEAPEPGEEEPVPGTYVGRIENRMVDWTNLVGGAIPFPTAEPAPVRESVRISFEGVNLSDVSMRLKAEVWLTSPSGAVTYHDEDTSSLPYSKDTAHKFVFPMAPSATPIDAAGEWKVKINLTNSTGEYLLDQYDGALFMAEEKPKDMWAVIGEMMPLMMIVMMFGMMIPMTKGLAEGGEE